MALNEEFRRRLRGMLPGAFLVVLVAGIYLAGLAPGVGTGDSAGLQYASALLGICHTPGYQIEVTLGKLFTLLPIGGSVAWRLNLLMAICGVAGSLALYGAVRRITGEVFPALVAATTLAFSTTYWSFSLITEAYVFYGAFLLLAVYAAVRFVGSDKVEWLYLMMLALGVTVGDRSSELFILPGFLGLLILSRERLSWNWTRVLVSVLLLILPLAFSVTSIIIRSDPSRLPNRDDMLRDQILGDSSNEMVIGVRPDDPPGRKIRDAISYSLALRWARTTHKGYSLERTVDTLSRYGWRMSGAGARRERLIPGTVGGTIIGPIGILLALVGTVRWRHQPGWLVLGWGLFLGNLLFISWHHRWDNLTFTVPGVIGLSLLAGLGASRKRTSTGPTRRGAAHALLCLLVPAFLLFTNYRIVDLNTPEQMGHVAWRYQVRDAPWPKNSVIITSSGPTVTFRYLFYVEGDRPDIRTIQAGWRSWPELISHFQEQGQPVYLYLVPRASRVPRQELSELIRNTREAFARLGFVRAEGWKGFGE